MLDTKVLFKFDAVISWRLSSHEKFVATECYRRRETPFLLTFRSPKGKECYRPRSRHQWPVPRRRLCLVRSAVVFRKGPRSCIPSPSTPPLCLSILFFGYYTHPSQSSFRTVLCSRLVVIPYTNSSYCSFFRAVARPVLAAWPQAVLSITCVVGRLYYALRPSGRNSRGLFCVPCSTPRQRTPAWAVQIFTNLWRPMIIRIHSVRSANST